MQSHGLLHMVLLSVLVELGECTVAFFWAVDNMERTQQEVMRNVAHIKTTLTEPSQIVLGHYKGSATDWDQKWHRDNVGEHYVEEHNNLRFKYHLMKKLWSTGTWKSFDYVWALDSDVDLLATDLNKFMQTVRDSNAHILSPSFSGRQDWAHYTSLLHTDANVDAKTEDERAEAKLKTRLNELGQPDPNCEYRRTNFAEMTAAMFSSKAVTLLFNDCTDCVNPQAPAEWGLDRVWCGLAKVRIWNNGDAPCAYIDSHPVNHLDWKNAEVSDPDFKGIDIYMQDRYPSYWAMPRVEECVPRKQS
mmetsp:Transcript_30137/g.54619  ORF Transcript_30137/g.54619 Transcript_30137/m.54619 type:complete len:303 (-) Transcript_30137:148-1056(-)